MKRLVILTGAGISAESGLATFRDSDGLWGKYNVMDVASHEGYERNPVLVHNFYNERRHELVGKEPNAAHRMLVDLEKDFDVQVITQNVDDLHERAGSKNVLHLHGEFMKVRTTTYPERIYTLPCDELSDKGLDTSVDTVNTYGQHVRPHIVFFGEDVPNYGPALDMAQKADIFVVIGTSLAVSPASYLLYYTRASQIYYIDPNPADVPANVEVIAQKATQGVATLKELLLNPSR